MARCALPIKHHKIAASIAHGSQ